ncbi:hypothetical protein DM558_07815 [Entomomonas moraniae]|uniref:Uncharacterized protein n=1 Tax=Entomomonas moraniae TaxID=2213226 RepID=A0A3S9XE67_9GAMM|nr:hypothetical protein [Entomomonas moraniae]AZS50691.1 hypothetical protein DM558_07815 [Entomomonas moraniae]
MRIEKSVKIVEASDICGWTIGDNYEFRVHEQYPDKNGVIHYYHVKPSNGADAKGYCLCINKDFAIKIAKLLNEDLKRGDV